MDRICGGVSLKTQVTALLDPASKGFLPSYMRRNSMEA